MEIAKNKVVTIDYTLTDDEFALLSGRTLPPHGRRFATTFQPKPSATTPI